jgi:N-acetylglutamate synthase-like GNAT family acetyltransferase
MGMTEFVIRPVDSSDREWISETIAERWGSEVVVVHQTVYTPSVLPGFIAVHKGKRVGLITYHIQKGECEIVSLDSLIPSIGIGTNLIDSVLKAARDSNCQRVWLITTNDNLSALRFYQRRGFHMVAIYTKAVDEARKIKPEIPFLGENGITIQDEIELELIIHASE